MLLIGWLVVSHSRPSNHWSEPALRWSLGAVVGFGLTSATYFIYLTHLRHHLWRYVGVEVAILLVLAWSSFRNREAPYSLPDNATDWSPTHAITIALGLGCVAALVLATATFIATTRTYPCGSGDGLAIWNLRARFRFLSEGDWVAPFIEYRSAKPDYPLLVPNSVARMWSYASAELRAAPSSAGVSWPP